MFSYRSPAVPFYKGFNHYLFIVVTFLGFFSSEGVKPAAQGGARSSPEPIQRRAPPKGLLDYIRKDSADVSGLDLAASPLGHFGTKSSK